MYSLSLDFIFYFQCVFEKLLYFMLKLTFSFAFMFLLFCPIVDCSFGFYLLDHEVYLQVVLSL